MYGIEKPGKSQFRVGQPHDMTQPKETQLLDKGKARILNQLYS